MPSFVDVQTSATVPDYNMNGYASCTLDGREVPKLGRRIENVLIDGRFPLRCLSPRLAAHS